MRIDLVLFSAIILIAFAEAQRKLNITKLVVNLEKLHRTPVWNRPPEERRKLSIFPRNNMKFVVTPNTVETNGDAAKEGLPTRRPLLRKFTMQDRNEKGTWVFAPRETLMKTNRFTVTLAPPISSDRKIINEKDSEKSTKVNSVENKAKTNKTTGKYKQLNKGNLIEKMPIKINVTPASGKRNKTVTEVIRGISKKTNTNDTKKFNTIQINDNSTLKMHKVTKNYPMDIRKLNDDDVIMEAIDTKDENWNEYGSENFNKTVGTLKMDTSKDILESRSVDLNTLKYEIEQNENKFLTMVNEESDVNESEYLTDETSNENSQNFTGEESNASSSNMAVEETSNESYLDQSNNLTEELSNEYTIEFSNHHTEEEISSESSSNMATEEKSNESYPDQSSDLIEEASNGYVIVTSNNFTREESPNESSTLTKKMSEKSEKSYNLNEEIQSGIVIETIQNLTDEKVSMIIDENNTDDKSVRDSKAEIAEAFANRFKRSNNIIEEESLPTTISGFKYTGSEITLNHDLSYRNINA